MTYVDELLRIYSSRGRLDPQDVVADATPDDSPLHEFFTWDDSEAAHKYRLTEARTLIRKAKITLVSDTNEIRVPAFVHIDSDGPPGGYVATADAVADPASRAILLRQLQRDVRRFVRRYEAMSEAAQLVDELRGWLAEHGITTETESVA